MDNRSQKSPVFTTGTWQLDRDHSELWFRIKHLTLVSTTGKIENFDVGISINQGRIDSASFSLKAAMDSINTLHSIRDQRLKEPDFLDVGKHPDMQFVSESLTPTGTDNTFELNGHLGLKGIWQAISLKAHYTGKAKDSYSGELKMGWHIEGVLDRRLWNIDFNLPFEGNGAAVGHRIAISAELEFKKSPSV